MVQSGHGGKCNLFSFAAFMARGLQKPFAVFMQDCACSQISGHAPWTAMATIHSGTPSPRAMLPLHFYG
jgi:hypothetical protein